MDRRPPVTFARHAVGLPAGAALGATLYTIIVATVSMSQGQVGGAIVIAPIVWVASFVAAILHCAFWLTLVWPVTRRRGRLAGVIASLAGATGAVTFTGGAALVVGRSSDGRSLFFFAGLGAVTGIGYWIVARGSMPPPHACADVLATAPEQ